MSSFPYSRSLCIAYRVDHNSSKYCRCHSFPIFRIIVRAHHAVVVRGEHAADCAEYYDAEDGDYDAISSCKYCVLWPPWRAVYGGAYHVHALKADTTGFMITFGRLAGWYEKIGCGLDDYESGCVVFARYVGSECVLEWKCDAM